MAIRASAEDYLETILLLTRKTGAVRSVDIGEEMGFSRPSVSIAMKKLREDGMIRVDEDNYISLTKKGEAIAARVYGRHETLYDWLVSLGIGQKTAAADACRMEHIISEESFQAIKASYETSRQA